QAITGATVTNGATPNATLTIQNVRVGATTTNYQVANTGTTGPSLRGAIQTTVNGANLTDSRLSGAGVTPSNYNTGAPGSNSGNLGVTFTAVSAGALAPLTGQVLNLTSNFSNIGDQKLNIVLASGAAAFNAAVGNTTPSPVVVANQRVGGSNSTALTVMNQAPAGSFSEDLNAAFGANTGAVTNNGGAVSQLLAGGSNAAALSVGVNTATAGVRSGTVTLNYQTNGTVGGTSNGLGVAGANGPQVINVSGNVYQAASGQLVTAPLNFGTVQVGQVVSQNLQVTNNAAGPAGFVEDLNASFGAATGTGAGLISGSGSLSGITAGSTSNAGNGALTVAVNTSSAGSVNGSIAVNYFSAGAVNGVSNGLGTLAVGAQGYGVQGTIQAMGNVINQASPQINNGSVVNLGAARVGGAALAGTVSVTNVATASPQAALNASIAPTSGPITASGSFNLLNPGATNASSLQVGLSTAVAGNYTGANAGQATLQFVSDASNVGNCAPNCQMNLAPQTVAVAGKVYAVAVGQTPTTALDFGVVRVGDTVSARNIVVNNTAAVQGLNDTLRANVAISAGAAPFGAPASVGGIAAQTGSTVAVGLDTSTAGVFSRSASVSFLSQNPDLADVSAGATATVALAAQINNLANGDFGFLSGLGTLTNSGSNYLLDLGTVTLGDMVATSLQFANSVAGPADALSGLFDLMAADDFNYSGFNAISNLAAGQAIGGFNIDWFAAAVGMFSDTVVFNGVGTNASDPVGLAQTRQLTIRANVVSGGPGAVPEPGSLSLLLAAALAGLLTRRKMAVRRSGSAAEQPA
ncbi:MAG: choice-of-anchor D domain-containing protein, partial [Rubrivivax sp.]